MGKSQPGVPDETQMDALDEAREALEYVEQAEGFQPQMAYIGMAQAWAMIAIAERLDGLSDLLQHMKANG